MFSARNKKKVASYDPGIIFTVDVWMLRVPPLHLPTFFFNVQLFMINGYSHCFKSSRTITLFIALANFQNFQNITHTNETVIIREGQT